MSSKNKRQKMINQNLNVLKKFEVLGLHNWAMNLDEEKPLNAKEQAKLHKWLNDPFVLSTGEITYDSQKIHEDMTGRLLDDLGQVPLP